MKRTFILLILQIFSTHFLISMSSDEYSKQLNKAVQEKDLTTVEYLLNYVSPKQHRQSHLHVAIDQKNLAAVQLLIEKKADVNKQDWWLETPLHKAIRNDNSNTGVIELLLNAGAQSQIKNRDSRTPFHLAIKYGKSAIVDRLLKEQIIKEDASESLVDYLAELHSFKSVVEDKLKWDAQFKANIEKQCNNFPSILKRLDVYNNDTQEQFGDYEKILKGLLISGETVNPLNVAIVEKCLGKKLSAYYNEEVFKRIELLNFLPRTLCILIANYSY